MEKGREKLMKYTVIAVVLMFFAVIAGAQDIEEKALELEGKIIAPCCWSQPVSQHYSQAADEIRVEVRRMLAEGKTSQQILDHYVSMYGQRILASPPARGFNILAYVLPYFSLGLGVAVVMLILKKLRSRTPAAAPAAAQSAVLDAKYSARLEKELREIE